MFEEYATMRLEDIKPYPKNPRVNDEAVPMLYNSIRDFGYVSRIAVNQDGVILSGHTRLKALKRLYEDGEFERGYLKEQGVTADAIPVKILHFRSEEEEMMYRLADNKTGEKAGWDFDLLDPILGELKDDFDPSAYGFDFDLWGESEEAVAEDEVVSREDAPGKPKAEVFDPPSVVSLGEEVRLGPHTLVCGYPDRDVVETAAAGRRTLAIACSDGSLFPDDIKEAVLGDAAFVIWDPLMYDEFVRDLFDRGWQVTDFLHWDMPTELSDLDTPRAMGTIAVVGSPSEDLAVIGDGVCRDRAPSGMLSWLVRALTREGDVVVDLTGGQKGLIDVCDSLGRACVSFCADPSACDCAVAAYNERHAGV